MPVDGVEFAAEDGAAAEAAAADAVVHKAVFDLAHAATDDASAARLRLLRRFGESGLLLDPLERALPLPTAARSAGCGACIEHQPAFLGCATRRGRRRARARGDGSRALEKAGCAIRSYKPLLVCGPASHELAVVLREEGLAALRPPLLLQFVRRRHAAQGTASATASTSRSAPRCPTWRAAPRPGRRPIRLAAAVPDGRRFRRRGGARRDGGTDLGGAARRWSSSSAVSARLRVNLLGSTCCRLRRPLIVDVNYFPVSTASFPSAGRWRRRCATTPSSASATERR